MPDLYELVDLYWIRLCEDREDLVVFWPVFRRPGRQRRSRLAFDHPSDASIYGMRVQARYAAFCRKVVVL